MELSKRDKARVTKLVGEAVAELAPEQYVEINVADGWGTDNPRSIQVITWRTCDGQPRVHHVREIWLKDS